MKACEHCGHQSADANPKSAKITLSCSLTALIFYIPANMFPFMTLELYGNRSSSTIWQGILSLADSGAWFVALVVFLASILIPFIKLLILFYLSIYPNKENSELKMKLYNFVEAIGRWSMLDIFLLAILVAIMKLGGWTQVQPEVGSLMFAFVVIFTMIASAYFDPKLIWKDSHGENKVA